MATEPPNNRCRVSTNAMEKLKQSVFRLCSGSSRSSPLTPSHVEDQLRSLFASPQLLRTPDHPPYSEMIINAIGELNERGGSKEDLISSFIESKYEDLPFAHPRLLSHHLGKLAKSGEIALNAKLRYVLPQGDASPNCERRTQERSERSKKRSRSRGGKDKANGSCKQSPLGALKGLENPDVLFKKPRTRRRPRFEKSDPGRLGVQELVLQGENVRVTGVDDDVVCGSSQVESANVNGKEYVQEANRQKESIHRLEESVVIDKRVESVCTDNVCVLSHESDLIPMFETEFLESNLEKQIESQTPFEQHGEEESVEKIMASVDHDNNYTQEHGKRETWLKDQKMAFASDGDVLCPQLERTSVIETESLQNLNRHTEPLEPGRSDNIHEPEQQIENQMTALAGDEAISVSQMEQLELPDNSDVPPPEQQGEKTEKSHQGRDEKEQSVEDNEMQELLVEGHTTTSMGDEKNVIQNELRHGEQQSLQTPESQLQLQGNPLLKKKDGRGRPKKRKPEFEEQLRVLPLRKKKMQPESGQQLDVYELESEQLLNASQKKNDGRGRSMKKKLESEQQLEVDPLQNKKGGKGSTEKKKPELAVPLKKKKDGRGRPRKTKSEYEKQLVVPSLLKKKDGRGRPKKMKTESEQQSDVGEDSLQKKKDGRGRPKKKKPESEQQLEVDEDSSQKKKDGRGRPKKKKMESELQLEVGEDSLQKKKDGRGRPKKKKPESEQQLDVDEDALQKKKDGRGRPKKKKPESEQKLDVDEDALQNKKDGRGRPKKKKQEPEQQLEVDEDSFPRKKDGRGRPKKNKPESEQQLQVDEDCLQKEKDGRGRSKKNKPESEEQLQVDGDCLQMQKDGKGRSDKKEPDSEQQLEVDEDSLGNKKDGSESPKKKRPESEQEVAVDFTQEEKDGRGRLKKKIPDFEQQGEEQLVLQDENIVGSVAENDFTHITLAELFPKCGPGSLKKSKDSVELSEKQQLPQCSLGRPSRERKESEALNAAVDDAENSLRAHSEVTGGSLATEPVPSQQLDSEMVKDRLMDPPRKKLSKTTLKHMQELLPRRQLRSKSRL